MEWSKYNIFYEIDNTKSVLYNYAWDNAIMLTNELMNIVKNHMEDIVRIRNIHPDLYNEFLDKKFIILNQIVERNEIISKIKSTLNSKSALRLTVNPTLDCNLKCWYCYETHIKNSILDKKTATAIIKFVQFKILNPELKHVELAFFGGEPLIKANECAIPLLKKIKHLCIENNKTFIAHFTTNAVLLTKEIVDSIATIHSNTTFQIAFDGDRKMHNKVKYLRDIDTYELVMNNIDYGLTRNLKFNIRCNYNENNIDSFEQLIYDLASLPHIDKSLLHISLQKVWQAYPSMNLYHKAKKLYSILTENGFNCTMGGLSQVTTYCYADYKESYVINYNGDVFKCTARDFTSENRVGILNSNGNIVFEHPEIDMTDVRFKNECYSCILLPICTVCSQKHKETLQISNCPLTISEEEKSRQIKNKFKEMYSIYL